MAKAKRLKRSRSWRMENESRGPSDDGMSPEETASPTRCSEGRRNTGRKKVKVIQILVKLMDETSETRKMLENHIESNNHQNIMFGKYLEKLTESLEKLNESHNDPRKQLELHTSGPRSQWNQEQPPRYRLIFRSEVSGKIEKGKTTEIHVALVDVNNGQTVKNGPLASATVELVVIDAKFNENDNQYSWSREDFVSNIRKAPQGNSATINVEQSVKSIVSNGRFNLENGDKRHCDFTIFSNSGNKKVRLGVMVVSPTQERVLEGLSNPFFVRGHDRPNRKQARVDNGNQEQNVPMSNMRSPSCPNSTQADGNGPVTTPVLGGQYQPVSQINTFALSTEPATSEQHQVLHQSMLAQAANNQTLQAWFVSGNQEQNGPMSNMQNPSCPNSSQAYGNGSVMSPVFGGQNQQQHQVPHWSMLPQASNYPTGLNAIGQIHTQFIENIDVAYTEPSAHIQQVQQAWIPQNQDNWPNLPHQPMNNGTGTPFYTNQRAFPVRLVWDMPSVVPSKHCFNLLDQFMPLDSWQPKFKNCGLPTTCLMQEHFGSVTTMPKEVMQTRRGRGVLIEPLEPDDSDEGRPQKRKLHSKYQLRFVNKVCETYYTWDQIKADEGNLLKVALFDENNTKITSGPLSSASVEVIALHGDFNCDGQDYWTSEEFNRSIVCPLLGEEASSVLGGDSILVLSGGEACVSDAFFQRTSFCARTGKFKMGVMLASAQEERVQEGISEPFQVMDNRLTGEYGRIFGKWPEEDSAVCASINHPLMVQTSMWHLLSMVKRKASSYLLDQYKVMEGMEKHQKNLESMLLEILNIIEHAEEKEAFHDVVTAWLSGLKKVIYEANDIFDEFKHEALRREAKENGHHSMLGMEVLRDRNPIVFRYRMGKKLCKIVQTIEVLVTEMNALGFKHMQQATPSKQLMKMEPILFDSDMDIVRRSRDKEKNKILGMLLHEASNMDLMVLPIFGMGGMGKTTLVELIYNDPAIEKHFELQRWCCVSQDFDATNIANKICQTNVNDQDCEKALKDLQSIVNRKRYLIVLDNIWNMDEAKWGKLMTCLKQGGKGSVVLITTHDVEVARIMKMGAAEAYNIEKLSPQHLKEIVLSRAFSLQKPNGKEHDNVDTIVNRCAGCPLVAKTLGSVLSTMISPKEWEGMLDSDLWNINEDSSDILSALKLSYMHLPSHLKLCFSYCALFPKGYQIDKDSLIEQWLAHDFIPVQGDHHPETVGEEILKELTWRSFFEEVKQTSPIEYGKRLQLRNRTMYKMHDLMHDLAQYVAGEECFTIVDKPFMKKLLPNATRHLFMSRDGINQLDDFSKKEFSTLRTLFCTDNGSSLHISKLTSLQVLHLPQLEHLGFEVCQLTNLRYLNLSRSLELKELPNNIGRLSKLQTLDISYCPNLLQLPKDIKYMESLRHLYTNGCKSLICMPPGLGQITSLQTLTFFVVGAGSGCSTIRELQNLNLGGELELNCLQNATEELAKAANLESKGKLTHLSLRWNSEGQEEPVQHCPEKVLNALKPHSGLQMLRIVGYKGNCLPSWMTDLSQLQHLTEFHLHGLVSCNEFPQLCQLKALRILYLEKLNKLQSLCSHVVSTPFPALKELRLHDLEILEKWVATEGKELIFPVLEEVVIKNCPMLTCLPEAPKLKHIELDEGKSLLVKLTRSWSMLLQATRPHQIGQNPDLSLSELNLKGLPQEDRDESHAHSSNRHEVSQGYGLELCITRSSCGNVDQGRCHDQMASEQSHKWIRGEQRRPILPVSEMLDDGWCQEISGNKWIRREQRRPILPVSEMLDDGWCQEISGDGDFARGDDTESKAYRCVQLSRGSRGAFC